MGKRQTWAGCGAVAAGIVAAGAALDAARARRGRASLAAAALAGAYLGGTFSGRSSLFGRVARMRRDAGLFALTFDDGPDPRFTPRISRILADRGHRATFFVLGRAVEQHPELACALLDDGHELASHGDDHRLLAFAPPREVRRQLARTEHAVRAATGSPPARLFRAPHGVRSPWLVRTVQRRGYQVCAWDGAVFDTARPGSQVIAGRVVDLLAPGAVILLHDGDGSGGGASREQTVAALPSILDRAERAGLRSVCVSELAER